jgi:4-hydroxy-tetrahydrodipicolinate synthase
MTDKKWDYSGIFPAMQCPFKQDLSIDEKNLREFTSWLMSFDGVGGLVPNGHTGEVFALTSAERTEVTRIVADEVGGKIPVVSGLCREGITEACEDAEAARDAGAAGLLVMPPHYWLRFGMEPEHVVDYFDAIGKASGLDQVVHVYPSWCKASYSEELLRTLVQLPWVKCVKLGTREMNKYARDIQAIRAGDPSVTILTCHDEYILPSMVQGVDGALVGFASFIPDLITELFACVKSGDLTRAMEIQNRINALKDAVYGEGEPTGDAHARMKVAMVLTGRLGSYVTQPPIREPDSATVDEIRKALTEAGMMAQQAVE